MKVMADEQAWTVGLVVMPFCLQDCTRLALEESQGSRRVLPARGRGAKACHPADKYPQTQSIDLVMWVVYTCGRGMVAFSRL